MKNASLGLNIVLTIAVVVLYVLHFNSTPTKSTTTKVKKDQVVQDIPKGTIAFINEDSLYKKYAFFTETRELLALEQRKAEEKLFREQNSFQQKVAKFQNDVAKHLITRTQQEQQEKDLGQEQQRLQSVAQSFQMEMAQRQQKMNKDLLDSIHSFIDQYNENIKYSYIIGTSGTILYGDENLDITEIVVDGLNNRYKGNSTEEDKKKEEQ